MAAATAPRKTISIYDYPEHLNPFHDEDNHNKIRFWSIGRRLNRSNSISFSGLKDLKNSWALRSFMKKGKKGTTSEKFSNIQLNEETSPIIYRRTLQYSGTSSVGARSTVVPSERSDRYVYGGSITPLPRSRFQERLRSTSHHEVQSLSATPRLARSDVSGSRLSVESTNPFDEDGPVAPVRASRQKKKRAPLPPEPVSTTPENAVTTAGISTETQRSEVEEKICNKTKGDLELEDMNLNIELKIIEDEDVQDKFTDAIEVKPTTSNTFNNNEVVDIDISITTIKSDNEQTQRDNNAGITESKDSEFTLRNSSSEEDILNSSAFYKVDIVKYRRNSSVNEDDIRLRRVHLEDSQSFSNKRSKSLTNALDTTYSTNNILNENTMHMDTNGNDSPRKVVCKLYDNPQTKKSVETISSTEKEFLEIDKATRELEREINKLNSALNVDDIPCVDTRLSVSEIKRRFDKNDTSSPNPIPKPRRSHYGGGSSSP